MSTARASETLKHTFEGADQVLVISASIRGPQAAAASKAAVDAAVGAGASRVLYTSHQMASHSSPFAPAREHAATEAHLAVQDVAYTALRHGFYASTFEYFLPVALQTGELRLPADGPVSWTAHDDLAEADAIALTSPGELDGTTPPLVAAELLDFSDVARVVSELTGRTLKRIVVDDEQWKADVTAQGMPADAAEFTLGIFRAARAGEMAVTDRALETLIGRPSIPARSTIETIVQQVPTRT